MNLKDARTAIETILDQIDDFHLPETRIERNRDSTIAWFGGQGFHLGRSERNGKPDAAVHRSMGIGDLFNRESASRIDKQFMADGTIPEAFEED